MELSSKRRGSIGRFTGPAYPFRPGWAGVFGPKSDKEVVLTSLINIATTLKGTIPYDPNRGSEVPGLLFELHDEVTFSLIRYFAKKDIEDQDPRINVAAVQTEINDAEPNTVRVRTGIQIVGDKRGDILNIPVTFDTAT